MIILGMSSSQLTKTHIFQMGRLNHQPDGAGELRQLTNECHHVIVVLCGFQKCGNPPVMFVGLESPPSDVWFRITMNYIDYNI